MSIKDISTKELKDYFKSDKKEDKTKKEEEKHSPGAMDTLNKIKEISKLKGKDRQKAEGALTPDEKEILLMFEKKNKAKKTRTTDQARRLYVYNKDIKWLAIAALCFTLFGFFLASSFYPQPIIPKEIKDKIKSDWREIASSVVATIMFLIAGGVSSYVKLKCKPGMLARFLQDNEEKKKEVEESKEIDAFGRTIEVERK